MRFYDPKKGAIRIDGRDIPANTPKPRCGRTIGIVNQDNFLFHDTIANNIRYGKLDATDEESRRHPPRPPCPIEPVTHRSPRHGLKPLA